MRVPFRKPGKFAQVKPDPLLTKAKFAELEKKLARLKSARPQAAAEVARLAELGDFSENVEYQLAKGRLRGLNANILKLEHQLNSAVIIAPAKQTGRVEIGSTVTVVMETAALGGVPPEGGKTYQILGSSEADPAKGIISHSSPLGEALIGKKIGETVRISRAGGETAYAIVKIQ